MFEWADNYPDLQNYCRQFERYDLEKPIAFNYAPLEALIQNGPQCGLVALAMCSADVDKAHAVQAIFDYAKSEGFSRHGEMFSARNMTTLARKFLPHLHSSLFNGALDCDSIRAHLRSGCLILVPYDNDKDFHPCMRNGHKAHWALVCGYVDTEHGFSVIVRQGKSRMIRVWGIETISASNQQLNEICPNIVRDGSYVVPECSINGPDGLACFSVVMSKTIDY